MILEPEVLESLDKSVLCWMATASADGQPNVSPKEVFSVYGCEHIIIANVASPGSARNISENESVCVSFIDILVQKGFQIHGIAKLCKKGDRDYSDMEIILGPLAGEAFPFASIFKIKAESVKAILAPRDLLYPETKESEQIERAKAQYKLL